jgi:hypothetical protein
LQALAGGADLYLALRAAVALTERGGFTSGLDLVRRGLAAPSRPEREAALNALAVLVPADQALALVREILTAAEAPLRLAAARAALRLGERTAAITALAALLRGPAPIRVEAGAELARLGDSRGRRALAAAATAPSLDTRMAAVAASRQLNDIGDGLVIALADSSPLVRVAAATAILDHLP